MKTSKNLAVFGLMCVLVSLAAVTLITRARHRAHADRGNWERQEAALQSSIDQAMAQKTRAERALAALPASPSQPLPEEKAVAKAQHPMDWSAYLVNHPEMQRAYEAAYGAVLAQRYGPLYRRLGLTADQTGRLDELMAKDVENNLDLMSVARARNLPFTDPAIVQLRKNQEAELATQEQAVIGPDNAGQLQQFNAEMYVRGLVGVATSTAVASESGMSADLEEQATQLILKTNAAHQQNPAQLVTPDTVDWSVVATQGQSFLNPNQIAAIQSVAAEEKFVALKRDYFQKQAAAPK